MLRANSALGNRINMGFPKGNMSKKKSFAFNDAENDVENMGAKARHLKGLKLHRQIKRSQGKIHRKRKPLGRRNANVLSNMSNQQPSKGRTSLAKKGPKFNVRVLPAVTKVKIAQEKVPDIEYVYKSAGSARCDEGFEDEEELKRLVSNVVDLYKSADYEPTLKPHNCGIPDSIKIISLEPTEPPSCDDELFDELIRKADSQLWKDAQSDFQKMDSLKFSLLGQFGIVTSEIPAKAGDGRTPKVSEVLQKIM